MKTDEWFQTAFGDDYLLRYAHRDLSMAQKEVEFLLRELGLSPQQEIFDLACGSGRHLLRLREQGLNVIGADLSRPLLDDFKGRESQPKDLVQCDMRKLPFGESFDVVTMMFSSFGYFSDVENVKLLQELATVVKGGGILFLDLMNRPQIEKTLVPHSLEEMDGWQVESNRAVRLGRVEKEIIMRRDGDERRYEESVRMYTRDEIERMMQQNGFVVGSIWGDYDSSDYTSDSKRMLIRAEKNRA